MNLLQRLNSMTVSVSGAQFNLNDLCYKVCVFATRCLLIPLCFLLRVSHVFMFVSFIFVLPVLRQPAAPAGFEAASPHIPCIRVTVLDCFREGGFDFSQVKETKKQAHLHWTLALS